MKKMVYACSGASNVGQTANAAGLKLREEHGIPMSCGVALGANLDNFLKQAGENDENIILDGCPVACLQSICTRHNIPNTRQVIVTELGIPKEYGRPVSDEDIDRVLNKALG